MLQRNDVAPFVVCGTGSGESRYSRHRPPKPTGASPTLPQPDRLAASSCEDTCVAATGTSQQIEKQKVHPNER